MRKKIINDIKIDSPSWNIDNDIYLQLFYIDHKIASFPNRGYLSQIRRNLTFKRGYYQA